MDKRLGLKTLNNTYLARTQGLTNLIHAFMTYKNRGLLIIVYKKSSCKNPDFHVLHVKFVKKRAHVHILVNSFVKDNFYLALSMSLQSNDERRILNFKF